jgi:gamma-glutamyl hercynylcysteine S-oxide synthase
MMLAPSQLDGLESVPARLAQYMPVHSHIGELTPAGAIHPDPWVREAILRLLVTTAPEDPAVQELACWMTHDFDDYVAFAAIASCGDLKLTAALRDLMTIVGPVADRLGSSAGKPVGVGHAIVLRAILAIAGTDARDELKALVESLFDGVQALDLEAFVAPAPEPSPMTDHWRPHAHDDMVQVPGGAVTLQVPTALRRSERLCDWSDVEVPEEYEVGPFRMDVLPVTNQAYDEFAASSLAREHVTCHEQEPPGKNHVRNTFLEPGQSERHPAAGIDWFDAYSFATAHGKRLPTEAEWQWAAGGATGWSYPWGDTYDPSKVHCMVPPPAGPPAAERIKHWRDRLVLIGDAPRQARTRPVGTTGNRSPFGLLDMAGNVWEWTASSFHTRGPVQARVGDADALDLIYDWRSYVTIRGGAATSLPEQTSVGFRGKDLLVDRHFEIGFRCVCDCA